MKYVDGGTLVTQFATLRRSVNDPTRLRSVANQLIAVARAVHFAHQRGILHRDLKPGNILLDADNTPYVADFGLAKRTGEQSPAATATGAILGTPTYMAPEQARSEKTLTTAVDVYALGAILYEIITGKPPFEGPTPVDVIMQVLEKEPAPPQKMNPKVDRDLATIAMKCLEKEPNQRYATASGLADELDRWSKGEPIFARPVSRKERLGKWVKRNKMAAAMIAVSVIAAIAIPSVLIRERFVTQAALNEKTQAVDDLNNNLERQKKLVGILRVGQIERALDKGDLIEAQRCLHLTETDQRCWEWNWLARRILPDLRVLPLKLEANEDDMAFFSSAVNWKKNVSLSRCGRYCAAGFDKTNRILGSNPDLSVLRSHPVRIYDFDRNEVICTLADAMEAGHFSPDGRRFAAVSLLSATSADTQATIWDLKSGQAIQRFGPINPIFPLLGFLPDGKSIVFYNSSMGNRGGMVIHELTTGQERPICDSRLDHVRFSSDSRWMLASYSDSAAILIDLSDPKAVRPLAEPMKKAKGVGFAPNDSVVVAEFVSEPDKDRRYDGYVNFVTRAMNGEVQTTVRGPRCSQFGRALFTPDGRFALLTTIRGEEQHRMTWFEVATGKPAVHFVGGRMRNEQMQFSERLDRVAWIDGDFQQPVVWDVVGNRPDKTWPLATDRSSRIAKPFDLDNNGRLLAMQTSQSIRQIRDTRIGDLLWQSSSSSAHYVGTAVSPDGQVIAGRDYISRPRSNNALELINPRTNKIQATISNDTYSGEFTVEGFSPDSSMLAISSGSKWMFHSTTGQRLFSTGHNSNIECAAFSRDSKHVALGGGEILILRTDNWSKEQTLIGDHSVTGIAFAPDGHRIAVVRGMPTRRSGWKGDKPNNVEIWNWKTTERLAVMVGHTNQVDQVAWSADGRRVFTMSQDGTLKVWDPDLAELVLTVPVPGAKSPDNTILPVFMKLSGDGDMLALGTKNQMVLWNGTPLAQLPKAFGDPFRRLVSHHIEWAEGWNADRLISSTRSKPLQTWDLKSPNDIRQFRMTPDESKLVIHDAKSGYKVWGVRTTHEPLTLSDLPPQSFNFAISPDGQRIAIGGGPRKIRKYVGIEKNQPKFEDVGEDKPGIITVRDLSSGQEICAFREHTSPIGVIGFLPDGRSIYSNCMEEKSYRVWNSETGEELRQISGKAGIKMMPDGLHALSLILGPDGKATRKTILWNLATGEIKRQFDSLVSIPMAVSPDGKIGLVYSTEVNKVGSEPVIVKYSLWDLKSDKMMRALTELKTHFSAARFRPDGRLVTCSSEGVTVWDPATAQPLERRRTSDGDYVLNNAEISADGKRILFGLNGPQNYELQFWNITDLPLVRSPDSW